MAMKVLVTGATGYIGKRLLPLLVNMGYQVICCARDANKFHPDKSIKERIEVIEIDLNFAETLKKIPNDIDFAYYLVHSMSDSRKYDEIERKSAINFREALNKRKVKQVIYLSGIVNAQSLSKHLLSRKNVELELSKANYALTTLRAGIIIGSGSASFEIIRDLVEKLPLMIAPKWLNTKCQPIGITDLIKILCSVLNKPETYHHNYDIAGNEILTYKEMLLQFAAVRGLKRYIWTVPVMTPKLSSYWLYFITSTSYKLASSLVGSMKVEVIARDRKILDLLNFEPLTYKECLNKAFAKIESNEIASTWKDSSISGRLEYRISDEIKVPEFGCFKDHRTMKIVNLDRSLEKIWRIGGESGWYYANWLWRLRGFIDKIFAGVGLRRGRRNQTEIQAGDSLDFWRVLYANKDEKRLLLYAEMKLPGEAWLEFSIHDSMLSQTATFRPR